MQLKSNIPKHHSFSCFNLSITIFKYLQYPQFGEKYFTNLYDDLSSSTKVMNYLSLIRWESGMYHSSVFDSGIMAMKMMIKMADSGNLVIIYV